ncbi:MAG: hypothetical protein RJA70_1246 [Pseudomonadota bacterium]
MKNARFLWLMIPALGLLELLAHGYFRSAAPRDSDWDALVTPLRELRKNRELVVVAPGWAEPHARRVFGDAEMPLRDVARPDESGYARAVEISLLGDRALPSWAVLAEKDHGLFTLRVLENPSYEQVHLDFIDHFSAEAAAAFTGSERDPRPCTFNLNAQVSNGAVRGHPTFPKERFECGGDAQFVGITVIEDERYRPRRCLWANPARGQATTLRFKQVTLHERIHGFGGVSFFDERDGEGGSVQLEARVGDHLVGKYQHLPGEGWTGFEFNTSTYKGQQHDVEFRTSAVKGRPRGFCFQADLR